MRKYIAIAILGALCTTASALEVKGSFGYRYDSQDVGNNPTINQDKLKAALKLSHDLNDKTKVVVGLRTGDTKTAYATFGDGNGLKNIDLNLAYVEYAPLASTKVTLGKMNQPWADSSSFFFDKDIKPEGLAVAFDAGMGLSATAYSLTVAEGGLKPDSKVKGFQVGFAKEVAGLDASAYAGVMNHDYAIPNSTARAKLDVTHMGAKVSKGPLSVFVDQAKNDKAALGKDDTALAYGLSFGHAHNPGQWDVALVHQKVEKNALSALWLDNEFALGAAQHEGDALVVNYVVAKGWKVSGKYYDAEVGATKVDNKHLMVDLNYMF
jgi:hypothetical protein